MRPARTLTTVAAALLGLGCAASAQTTVALKPTARVADERPITLADVADLSGHQAADLAPVVIVADARDRLPAGREQDQGVGWIRVDLDEVRRALAGIPTVNWGRLELSGAACQVRLGTGPVRADAGKPTEDVEPGFTPGPDLPAGSIGAGVAASLAESLGVRPADLRLRVAERDRPTLDAPADGLVVRAVASGQGRRIPVRITAYRGDRVDLSRTVTVDLEVRRDVAVAAADLPRGETITAADFTVESRWAPPSDRPADPAAIEGFELSSAVRAGSPIMAGQVELPLCVARGSLVSVHCVSGTLVVQTTARARSAGRDGDLIEFETLDADPGRRSRFFARVSGPGRAVVVASEPQP